MVGMREGGGPPGGGGKPAIIYWGEEKVVSTGLEKYLYYTVGPKPYTKFA